MANGLSNNLFKIIPNWQWVKSKYKYSLLSLDAFIEDESENSRWVNGFNIYSMNTHVDVSVADDYWKMLGKGALSRDEQMFPLTQCFQNHLK